METTEPTQTKERPNSYIYRYGGTATDIKIYYDTAEDLLQQLQELQEKSQIIQFTTNNIKETLGRGEP